MFAGRGNSMRSDSGVCANKQEGEAPQVRCFDDGKTMARQEDGALSLALSLSEHCLRMRNVCTSQVLCARASLLVGDVSFLLPFCNGVTVGLKRCGTITRLKVGTR